MITAAKIGHDAGDAARATTQNGYFQILGRVSLAAYGLVEFTIAYLAAVSSAKLAAGGGAGSANQQEAVTARVLAQPFATALLPLVAVGLACFGVYCLFDARYHRG